MIVLEQLNSCAEAHLTRATRDWNAFAAGIKATLGTEILLYHLAREDSAHPDDGQSRTWMDRVTIIAASNRPICEEYFGLGLKEPPPVPEETLAPLEPKLRTDFADNDDFRRAGPIAEHQIRLGIFYTVIVPAQLADGSSIHLFLWRPETEPDFNELEKQRLALFMRFLLAIIDPNNLIAEGTTPAVAAFGNRHGLTETESEILSQLLQGRSPKEIAEATNRTYGTVRWHIHNILNKCQVDSQKALLHEFYGLISR